MLSLSLKSSHDLQGRQSGMKQMFIRYMNIYWKSEQLQEDGKKESSKRIQEMLYKPSLERSGGTFGGCWGRGDKKYMLRRKIIYQRLKVRKQKLSSRNLNGEQFGIDMEWAGEKGWWRNWVKKTDRSQIMRALFFMVRSLDFVLHMIGNLLRILRRGVILRDLYFININLTVKYVVCI